MANRTTTHRTRAHRSAGYTLVEMVTVIVIMSVVGLVTSGVIMQGMKVYARTVPAMDAAYQVQSAADRLRREIRDLKDTDSITTFTGSALTFDDASDNTIAYSLSSGDLLRNGDLLAQGVTAFTFHYWKQDGTVASAAADLHLVEVDMTVQVGDQPYRSQFAVFPRRFSSVTGSGGGGSVSASPIAHWKLDETSGTTAVDSVGSSDGTLVNGVAWGLGGAPSGGTSADFDGLDDYIEVPHSSTFLLDDGTIQFWFNANDTSGEQTLLSKDSTDFDTGGHLTIKLNGAGVELRFQSTTISYNLIAGSVVSPGTWHYVAFTFGSSGMKLYFDGALRDSDSYSGGMGTTSGGSGNSEPMAFGAETWNSGDGVVTPLSSYYDGRIDAVAFYDSALSAADISILYAAGGAI